MQIEIELAPKPVPHPAIAGWLQAANEAEQRRPDLRCEHLPEHRMQHRVGTGNWRSCMRMLLQAVRARRPPSVARRPAGSRASTDQTHPAISETRGRHVQLSQ